jgi:hypothetical protein
MKLFILILLVGLVVLSPFASAITITNSTTRDITDIAYPDTLFYGIGGIAAIMLLVCIFFIFQRNIPASPLAITGLIGFSLFLTCSYMAPMVAKSSWIVSGTEAQYVSSYVLSPWVSYLCLGLATICLLFFGYGVLRYFQMLAEHHEYMSNPDTQFSFYLEGK